ncbi:MAG: hypothetical protein JJ979_25335 [Roseibium sp.]|nr:hypothetical protein [Roseibium sp.]
MTDNPISEQVKEKQSWLNKAGMSLITIGIPAFLGSGIATAAIEWFSKDRELDIKMVEIGLSVLRADPEDEDQIAPARQWAINIVEKHSGSEFGEEDAEKLLKEPIKIDGWSNAYYKTGNVASMTLAPTLEEVMNMPLEMRREFFESFGHGVPNNAGSVSEEKPPKVAK